MLSKVLKNLKKIEHKKSSDLTVSLGVIKKPVPQRNGFQAKANSQAGALRQRSIGNRMSKPSRSK
ncbi:MAG: hypothetical protein A2493_02055 [Candidatus Magasanikbacteria bacterium RIFOXYC12_FULL_33_11]|uniref:Uncharacterized protein n=1 Tax=Candidatus Magasanikbacteria bacterium RIFOXYC12_FULL_33_11 TaxID=1798701 RepID=A0A1F6NP47_9BACT|nr:MAG: hypothetical protein A2493_02055 [Candidatus Magasanikbacteria bacterium RIFOXYC12_FULL_33_11]